MSGKNENHSLNFDDIVSSFKDEKNNDKYLRALALEMEIPFIDLNSHEFDSECVNRIPEKIARRHTVIPVNFNENGKIIVAVSNPENIYAIDEVKLLINHDIYIVLAKEEDIVYSINKYYDKRNATNKAIKEFVAPVDSDDDKSETEEVTSSPVVRLVNSIIERAAYHRVSDIHIEPYEQEMRVRYRIDGILKEVLRLNISLHSPISIRVKIMSGIDISEKRKPQDGGMQLNVAGRQLDIRVSVLPTVHGEKIVMRLLDTAGSVLTREKLGLSPVNNERFNKIIKASEGIVLLTGPTGSGKTTTLYTVLSELNDVESNLITVEDPVEYRIEGINQVQVNKKAGLTFASGLRSILRQDPDIVMVGEMRDEETAQIGFKAAITGHLVLSTLHTNDTVSTLTRLVDMNIPHYMVSTAVNGVVAQRLIRKLCDNCKVKRVTTPVEMKKLKLEKPVEIYDACGCEKCDNMGYKGRLAVHEILIMTREIRDLIANRKSVDEIKDFAISDGMITLEQSCIDLVLDGKTTITQMDRLVYDVDM